MTSKVQPGSYKSYNIIPPEDAQNRHRFITAGDTAFIAISKDLVRKFNIDEKTWAYQYATENGIYIAFKNTESKETA